MTPQHDRPTTQVPADVYASGRRVAIVQRAGVGQDRILCGIHDRFLALGDSGSGA